MADLTTLEEKLAGALPTQERHLASVRDGSLELAADADPAA